MSACCAERPFDDPAGAAGTRPLAAAVGLAGCGVHARTARRWRPAAAAPRRPPGTAAAPARTGTPELRVDVVADGLSHVWDMGFLPDGQVLVTERDGAAVAAVRAPSRGPRCSPVRADLDDVYARGEGGLMGLVVHPDFAQSRRFTTCQTHAEGGTATDVRLVTWQLSADGSAAERVRDPLVGGLPINPSGRHSGCRPTIAADGTLLVGTGDTARGAIPQDLNSLGGKVLRIDLATGGAAPGQPVRRRRQPRPAPGLGLRPPQRAGRGRAARAPGEAYSAEHGPTTDDEVNLLRAGRATTAGTRRRAAPSAATTSRCR